MKGAQGLRPGEPANAGNQAENRPEGLVRAPALDTEATAGEVALAELRRLLAAWRIHEPGARLGHDPEALHQLRVTARRIDATLGLFKRQLPLPLSNARRTTKTVLRALGAARDLDVQLAELARYCLTLPEHDRAAAEPLRVRLEAERTKARARMLRALDSDPTRRWLEMLTQASLPGTALQGATTERAMLVMPERVQRRYRKLRKSVRRLRGKSSMEDYHLVRRRAKQLRYAIESGAAMFGRPAQEALKALRRLQDRLGAHQDAYIAGNRLASLAADPANSLPAGTLFLMGRLAEQHASSPAAAHKTLTRSWRKVRGRRWRALRTRLGELSATAQQAAALACAVPAEPAPQPPTVDPEPVASPESQPVKH